MYEISSPDLIVISFPGLYQNNTDMIRVLQVTDIINPQTFMIILTFVGLGTNIINIVIFKRQGLSNAINVSLSALAATNLGGHISLLWALTYDYPLVLKYAKLPYVPQHMLYMTAGSLRIYFVKMTGLLTIFITVHRCIAIVAPLKVKTLIAPARAGFIIVSLYVAVFLMSLFILYCPGSVKLGMIFDSQSNTTLLGMVMKEHFTIVESVYRSAITALQILLFAIMITSTAVLVIQLRQKSVWIQKTASSGKDVNYILKKDQRLGIMVTFLSALEIVCFLPNTMLICCSIFWPNFSTRIREGNLYYKLWSFVSILEITHSNDNILVYYFLSSKYRKTFKQLFHSNVKTKDT